ncbi:HypC/HybG/HupF family hydrogenase formation chaperone [Catelliglobosispora koreensis]|uniref:HypC/HybG/HupF family hydrogenase formation chaperone n=1 Tax=Catelliglobosispora koreensis TaxID=129052 RepID=UPI0003A5D3E0|nr:HypC/HybG/HupF family hydrogenase formation chaperone [Catelliglobosispora koreensis]
MCLAYAAKVVSVSDTVAMVFTGENQQRVTLLALEGDPPVPGDWVLVLSGLALRKLTEEERHEYLTP